MASYQRPQNLSFWIGLTLLFVSISLGSLTFFDGAFGVSATFPLLAGLCLVVGSAVLGRGQFRPVEPGIAVGFAAVLLCSDLTWRPSGALQAVEIPLLWKLVVLTMGGIFGLVPRTAIVALACVSISIAVVGFLSESGGNILFSDDHPAFMYRIHQLVSHFPEIPFFNTEWNGGVEAREFFPSGVLNLFIIWAPVFYAFDVRETYTLVIALTIFVLAPLCAGLSARLAGLSMLGCATATLLALLPTLLWYRWALKYGTMGFVVSCMLLPLNVVLAHRFSQSQRRLSVAGGVGTAVSITLMALWSLSNIAAIPAYLSMVARPRFIFTNRRRLLTLALLVAMNMPWMIMFVKFSPVGRFIKADTAQAQQLAPDSRQEAATTFIAKLKEVASESIVKLRGFTATLSIILVVGLTGLSRVDRNLGFILGVQIAWLALLGTVGDVILPHLELHRMLVMAAFISILPAARLLEFVFERFRGNAIATMASGICLVGPLLFVPFGVERVVRNRTFENYAFAKPIVGELSNAVRSHDSGGRLLIAGFILHEFSEGHVAPLPWFAGRAVIATSYQHDRWEHEDVVPPFFREQGEAGILRFLDLYDVSEVVTHERGWRAWYSKRPQYFQPIWRSERFTIFRRLNYVPSRILEGDAELLSESSSGFTVRTKSPVVVMKYTYLPFLTADACNIGPREFEGGVRLIELKNCRNGAIVSVRARTALDRIL